MRVISGTDVTGLSPDGLVPQWICQQVGQAGDTEGDAARLVDREHVAAGTAGDAGD
jgi:hypothetical protein